MAKPMSFGVGIYLFDEVEPLDFAGPYQVFTTAERMHRRIASDAGPLFRVFTVAEAPSEIAMRGGLRLLSDYGFADHSKIDLLIVPGGVIDAELAKPSVLEWLARHAEAAPHVLSICTGAFLLAEAGVLTEGRVTTHWEDIPDLRARYPQLDVVAGARWVEHGKVTCSAGISAGIDAALHLLSRLAGHELAERTARQMDYRWPDRAGSVE